MSNSIQEQGRELNKFAKDKMKGGKMTMFSVKINLRILNQIAVWAKDQVQKEDEILCHIQLNFKTGELELCVSATNTVLSTKPLSYFA